MPSPGSRVALAAALASFVAGASLSRAQDKSLVSGDKPGEPDIVARTRAQLGPLRAALAEIRGESLKAEVPVSHVTRESLDKDDSVDLDSRYDSRSDQIARAYARNGLFHQGFELRQFFSAFSNGVLAYYDPKKRAFFVVTGDLVDTSSDVTALHELNHALQDQRFDLRAYTHVSDDPDPIGMHDDALLARKLVVEGEACYVALLYEAKKDGYLDKVDDFLDKRAAMSRVDFSKIEHKEAAKGEGGKGALKAADSYDSLPLYLYRTMLDPYVKGPAIIAHVKKAGGWKAVDDLFVHPPDSTKQLLHLEKLRAPLDPVEVPDLSIVIGSGFKRTFENTFGEIGVSCVLQARALTKKIPEAADKIAATWTGDRFQAYETKERETCTVWVTSWETEDAAKEFEIAGKEIMKGEISSTKDSFVDRRGKRVLLVLGAPRHKTKALIDAVFGPRK